TGGAQPFLRFEHGHDHLYFFYPFYQDDARAVLTGYVGVKFDFQSGLKQLRKFRYLDMESVRVMSREGVDIPLDQLLPALQFRTVANPETRALEKIILRSFYEISVIIAAISLIGYLALV